MSLEWLRSCSADEVCVRLCRLTFIRHCYPVFRMLPRNAFTEMDCTLTRCGSDSWCPSSICVREKLVDVCRKSSFQARQYLMSIEGLGRKSVACILLLALQLHDFPVDVNVGRICARLGCAATKPCSSALNRRYGAAQ